MTRKIAVLLGSLRNNSNSERLARAIAAEAPKNLAFDIIPIGDLPFYNQDLETASPPAAWTAFRDRLNAADAVLFVTPEYNRSIPGVLKNAIDHASRPYGKSAWKGKPAALIGVSIGAVGTAVAQQHLRVILAYLDVPTLGQPEAYIQHKPDLYGSDGRIANEGTRKFVQGWLDAYVAFVQAHGRDRMRARTA